MNILTNYAYEAHHIAMEESDQPKTNVVGWEDDEPLKLFITTQVKMLLIISLEKLL